MMKNNNENIIPGGTPENKPGEIILGEKLVFLSVKPLMERILNGNENIKTIKGSNITEVDLTGIQFLYSLKKYMPDVNIEINYADDVKALLEKTGYKLILN